MIIETENDALVAIGDAEVRQHNDGEPVEFGDENRARVSADLGELLTEIRNDVTIAKDERATDDTDESTE